MLARTMHSIVYDAIHDEIIVPNAFSNAIMTFRGPASGEEPPIRVIQGPKTRLVFNDQLDADTIHNEIYVPNREGGGSIFVFDRTAQGNVAPIRILVGPDSGINGSDITFDPVHVFFLTSESVGRRILKHYDNGNVNTLRVITGG